MQVVETAREGLKRELKITVPKTDMAVRLDERLSEIKGRVQLKGFRQGKVPMAHLKKVYGRQAMAEIVNDLINKQTGQVLVERGERAAQKPDIAMTEDEKEADAILRGEQDFEFTIAYEVLPDFDLPDVSTLEIERPVAEVSDKEIEEQVEQIAESARPYEEKKGKAAKDDRITMDYAGSIDGTPFDGGTDTDATLVLGSGRFIPGFEDQLIGAKAGDETTVKVTFPADYQAPHLAGKEAEFAVKVTKVEKPGKIEINDDLAKQLGVESAEKLRDAVRSQLQGRYDNFAKARVKRQILDSLDEKVRFELPQKMVAQEFDNIWGQVTGELERTGKTFEDEETTEEKAREEYQQLAERRVRLGLVLAGIGEKEQLQVTEEELQRAIYDQVRRYPGQEQQVFEYFRQHPDAVAGLRAPIYEDKVVDLIVSRAKVTEKTVSGEELVKLAESED
ncbi:MAG TPA: trigger factor [Rhizobiaceae bacterium]|nr:trigger factor [Rhizobiaceae bacterium]